MARLPEEMLELIFTFLRPVIKGPEWGCYDRNVPLYKTLASICIASKACRRIATPILYHSVELPGPAPLEIHNNTPVELIAERSRWNAKLLYRSVLRDLTLATCIHELKIESCGAENITRAAYLAKHKHFNRLNEEDLERVKQAYKGRHLEYAFKQPLRERVDVGAHPLEGSLHGEWDDAEVALLIVLCQNLEYLEITFCSMMRISLPWRAIKGEVEHHDSGSFSRLREIKFREITPETSHGIYFYIAHLRPLFSLPSLRTFRGKCFKLSTLGSPPYTSFITSLHIQGSSMSSNENFKLMLIACPCLEEFEYSEQWSADAEPRFDMTEAYEDLRTHGSLVQKLSWFTFNRQGAPDGLREVSSLRHLCMPQGMLFGEAQDMITAEDVPELTETLPTLVERLDISLSRYITYWDNMDLADLPPPPPVVLPDLGEVMDQRIARLCEDTAFESLRSVWIEHDAEYLAEAPEMSVSGWCSSTHDSWVHLTRGAR